MKRGRRSIIGLLVFAAGLTVVTAPAVEAQNCRKGIPCGNSCISASKVCRIGNGTVRSAREPNPAAARPSVAPSSLSPETPAGTGEPPQSPANTADEYPWVGSFADGVYFRADCSAVQDLAPPNRRYFTSEGVARGAGYRRSRVPGC